MFYILKKIINKVKNTREVIIKYRDSQINRMIKN
jgi:hypothetical protein